MRAIDFRTAFEALTGNAPFPWQEALHERFAAGDPPCSCDLPTGLGKTSVIPIWLIALANHPDRVPRRLVYVVNRRTVVDQATDEARKVRGNVQGPLRERLSVLCAEPGEIPLGISTLRGEFADNREWSADPSRPAVIVGTVDMIGSRLLFSGYGLGFKARPLHAGFLGQDALLVHDEAHLEPAFQELIEAIHKEHDDEPALLGEGRRFRIMALTATRRGGEASRDSDVLTIGDEDRAHPVISKRTHARKVLNLHPLDDPKNLADRLAELASKHKEAKRAVLVFARLVEDVEKVAARLEKESGKQRVKSLTGTLRGKERDELVDTDVFGRFLPDPAPDDETVYLVCTSAGEVGVNISADHLVCDLSTFESMAQRFGRVNRFGRREDTEIDVVYPTRFAQGDDRDSRREKTLGLLRQLEDDASPDALGRLLSRIDREARLAAFSKEPLVPLTSDILFDSWAMTTVRGDLPGRPPVEPYLHGLSEDELPRTKVAWRNDVRYITRPLLNRYPPANLLADYPLKPHEILEDYSYRVFKHLMTLAQRHPDEPAWLVGVKGDVEVLDLKTLADKDRKDRINGRTVLLPPTVGGLSADGLLDGKSVEADDVADDWKDKVGEPRNRRRRERQPGLAPPEEMRLIRTIDLDPEADAGESEGAEDSEVGEEAKPARYWNWYARPDSADDDGSRSSKWAVAGDIHTEDVARLTERIVCALKLPDELGRSLVVAARLHDEGKKRVPWQKSIGNPKPTSWLAKSGKTKSGQWIKPVEIGLTYRHEFGSLLDAEEAPEFRALSDEQKDLVLHLIAAHHGHGRPHFDSDRAFDPERSREDADAMAAAVPRRFARLQRKYGRWGLAYLESILRAADWAASAEPSVVVESLP